MPVNPDGMGARARDADRGGGTARLLLGGILAGAILLAVSQFLPLYGTHVQARHGAIDSATVGSAHSYALLVVAAAAAFLGYGVWRVLSRPALLAVGALGVLSLVISLAHDLPYAHKQGLKSLGGHFVLAVNRPEVGLYLETVGALVLLLTCVCGFILLGPPGVRAGGELEDGGRDRPPVRA